MNITVQDFENLYTDEWDEACKAWGEMVQLNEQHNWERNRWLAACILQPWAKKALKPTDLALFPWENNKTTAPQLSKEQHRKRMQQALEKLGDTF